MNKRLLLIIGIFILAGSVVLYGVFANAGQVQNLVDTDVSHIQTVVSVSACDSFSLADAQSFLGQQAKQDAPIKSNVIDSRQSLTECSYISNTTPSKKIVVRMFSSTSDATLLAFNIAEGSDPQVIVGLGQKSYWDPSKGELHTLQGSYWLTVSYDDGTQSKSYELPQRVTRTILERL